MGEIIVDILLAAVILTAAVFRIYIIKKDSTGLNKKQKSILNRITWSALIALALQFVTADIFNRLNTASFAYTGRILRLAAYMAAYIIIGGGIIKKAFKGIKNLRVFDENFLMVTATFGALIIAVYENGDYTEAIAVMIFYQLGELFESYAVGKSRRNISELMDIRPDYANIEEDGKLKAVDPDTVEIGTVTVVKPGEKIAIDGVVCEGTSSLNTSALTGESMPQDVSIGDEVVSGCVNINGMLKIRTTKRFGESTVSKILRLVEDASSHKSKSENFISKFARYYTPAVCLCALALAVLPPLFRITVSGASADFSAWIYRALTFLVISCPCALVISIPLSFFAGIGGASKAGVLIKGSDYMEILSRTKTVVFDKTGTLTKGIFEVSEICFGEQEKEEILEYAALAEANSTHPIAKSIVAYYGKETDLDRVSNLQEISGKGIIAHVDDKTVAAGNARLMQMLGIQCGNTCAAGTAVHICIDGVYKGYISFADKVKEGSAKAIALLKKSGVSKTVMLTGDSSQTAEIIGTQLAIDEIHSELMPADKVSLLEDILKQKRKKEMVAFVGDGINDAPALTRADIGIAMGAMGSDAAIEAADVVLMDDDPMKIVKGIRISRKCIAIVYQNIVFALGIKFACLILGALGVANMWFAIFADVGVMVIAVLNAIRALRV